MNRIQATWMRRVVAEYRSAAFAAELLHGLIRIAVSPDTLELCHRVVRDELDHAELSRTVLLAAGGAEDAIALDPGGLSLWHAPEAALPLRMGAAIADLFCCGETVAVPLFTELRAGAIEQTAVAALDRILHDEPVHRGFGWTALDELLEVYGEDLRGFLQSRVDGYMQRIREAYGADDEACSDEERCWGLMAPAQYRRITEQCVEEVIRPRFAARGLA